MGTAASIVDHITGRKAKNPVGLQGGIPHGTTVNPKAGMTMNAPAKGTAPISKNSILRDEVNNFMTQMAKRGPQMGMKNKKGGKNPATSVLGG
jgi:hypothetical protein